jgi:hypothetical protein
MMNQFFIFIEGNERTDKEVNKLDTFGGISGL